MARQAFVARQPILDRTQRVVAYELLFRPSDAAGVSGTQSAAASAQVISDALLAFGLDTLTQGKLAFINVTPEMLVDRLAESLPPERVVLELLEDINADPEVVAACRSLRRAGYCLALDDFVPTPENAGLIELADYIKVDVLTSTIEARQAVLECRDAGRPKLLAEKVESAEQFQQALAEGFDYFQGFFFGRPVTKTTRDVRPVRGDQLLLLVALQDPELTLARLEELIRTDVGLCYRVLRSANAAACAQSRRVDTVSQALFLLGVDNVRRWVSIWTLAGLGTGHSELAVMSAVRGRTCEMLAQADESDASSDGFLLGMCSLLDVILDRPMEDLLTRLPLAAGTIAALRGNDNASRRRLDCVIACERGDWHALPALSAAAGLTIDQLRDAHTEALRWSATLNGS